MKYDKYTIEASGSFLRYDFYSVGPKGKIAKKVIYKPLEEHPTVFNLGFGDVQRDGEIDDVAISDNKDSEKILATVALTVVKFFEEYPDYDVFVTGSSDSRTRLYRIGISRNFEELGTAYNIFGLFGEKWFPFEKGVDYKAFLVRKKK